MASLPGLDRLAAQILALESSCNLVADAVNAQDDKSRTPLWYAAGEGHTVIVRLLLSKGVDVDSRDNSEKSTPLLRWQTEDVGVALIEAGANIDAHDGHKRPFLHYAVSKEYQTLVALLIGKGSQVNPQDEYGLSVLHIRRGQYGGTVAKEWCRCTATELERGKRFILCCR